MISKRIWFLWLIPSLPIWKWSLCLVSSFPYTVIPENEYLLDIVQHLELKTPQGHSMVPLENAPPSFLWIEYTYCLAIIFIFSSFLQTNHLHHSWQRGLPLLYIDSPILFPNLVQPPPPLLIRLSSFFSWMGNRATFYVLFYLMISWMDTYQALGPWCVFYATRHQVS